MSGIAVNPIPVVKNNLGPYRESLLRDKAKHLTALEKIDADLKLLDELARVLDIKPEMAVEACDAESLA